MEQKKKTLNFFVYTQKTTISLTFQDTRSLDEAQSFYNIQQDLIYKTGNIISRFTTQFSEEKLSLQKFKTARPSFPLFPSLHHNNASLLFLWTSLFTVHLLKKNKNK